MDSFLKTLKSNVYNYVSIVCDLGRLCCLYIKKHRVHTLVRYGVYIYNRRSNISFYLKVCVYSMQWKYILTYLCMHNTYDKQWSSSWLPACPNGHLTMFCKIYKKYQKYLILQDKRVIWIIYPNHDFHRYFEIFLRVFRWTEWPVVGLCTNLYTNFVRFVYIYELHLYLLSLTLCVYLWEIEKDVTNMRTNV